MLRRRYITLEIETDEGRPEDWDWQVIVFGRGSNALTGNTAKVVNVEEA